LYTGSGCPAGRQCQNQDAAIFQYNAGVSDGFQKVAHAFNGSPTLYPGSFLPPASYTVVYYENLNNVSPPNGLVYKVGRTTGETATNIANVSFCLDLVLYNQSGNDTGITLRCQSTATLPSQAGDSGAPVYISAGPGGVITGVGMVWGANGSGVTSFSSNLRQMLAIFNSAYFPGNTYEFAPTP
jgi:hypothetical protein